MNTPAKQRLDTLLVELGLAESREKARALVMAGSVLLGEQPATKPSQMVAADAAIHLKEELRYVSRGGLKLEAALDAFTLDPAGWLVADIGASTGGFTDCLLQRGAARVYAIDVGYGQLAWKLRQDARVVLLERTNVRTVQALPDGALVTLVVVDVSFIGLDLVLPAAARFVQPDGQAVVLIKPQFEAGKGMVGKGGVVRDPAVHRAVLTRVLTWASEHGWHPAGLIRSPITGPKGNVEFLAWLQRRATGENVDITSLIETVLAASGADSVATD